MNDRTDIISVGKSSALSAQASKSNLYRYIRILEHRILPVFFILLALRSFRYLWNFSVNGNSYLNIGPPPIFLTLGNLISSGIFNVIVAIYLFRGFTGSRRIHTFGDSALPILAQLFPVIPFLAPYLPSAMIETITWYKFTALTACFSFSLMASGIILATSGILALGRNFSITVSLNEIVNFGPYRYFRHPIYVGQVVAMVGFCIAYPTILAFCSLLLLSIIQTARATLENKYIYRG